MDRKVLFLTGAAGGIGSETCRVFGKEGYAIALSDYSKENGEKLLSELNNLGIEADFYCGDVTKPERASEMVHEAVKRFGRIDVVINAAGGLGGRSKVAEMTDDFYNHVMDLNMTSAFYITRAAIPYLKKSAQIHHNSSVINITSIAAYNGGGPGASIYAASKAAILGWSKGLAKELIGDGIRVNLVSPGTIDTPFHKATAREIVDSWRTAIPTQRLGTPHEVATVLKFLASEDAIYLVGETIQVNGGQMMD